MDDYIVADAQRNQLGPMPESEVRRLLAAGTITLDSLAWRPGMTGWEPLRAFAEFIDVPNPEPGTALPGSAFSMPMPGAAPAGPFNPYAPPRAAELFPSAAGSYNLNLPSAERGRLLTEEVLARGYYVDLGGCFSRAFRLVFSADFWPIIGVNIVTTLALMAASGCYANIVVNGPIMGGMALYYLRKIRGQEADLNTAFSGFSLAFTQLFLVHLISMLLAGLGWICCLIPGLYLTVAWIFATALVIDKKLEFWDAMQCSRKVVHKHWFPVFGLLVLGGLLSMAGTLACFIGLLVAMPVIQAALMYAYEDIFNPRPATGWPRLES